MLIGRRASPSPSLLSSLGALSDSCCTPSTARSARDPLPFKHPPALPSNFAVPRARRRPRRGLVTRRHLSAYPQTMAADQVSLVHTGSAPARAREHDVPRRTTPQKGSRARTNSDDAQPAREGRQGAHLAPRSPCAPACMETNTDDGRTTRAFTSSKPADLPQRENENTGGIPTRSASPLVQSALGQYARLEEWRTYRHRPHRKHGVLRVDSTTARTPAELRESDNRWCRPSPVPGECTLAPSAGKRRPKRR
ncbi:hypothetical protein BKA93DRAFT_397162 [Sparassis latifolia]